MIKYNENTINDWFFSTDNIIKVYKNNAVCYYKITVGGGQVPCYAVVDDISQYSDTEFEDVFNKANEKWYKLNNLNQYEEYGVYGSGRTITTYEGKLTIDGSYEYIYSGSSWVNIGEVSGSSITILSPEYLERNSSNNGYIGLGEYFQENTKIDIDFQMTQAKGNAIIGDYGSNDNDDWRIFLNYDSQVNNWLIFDFLTSRNYYNTGDWSKRFHIEIGDYYIRDVDSGSYLVNATKKTSFTRPNQMYLFHMDGTQSTNNIDYGHIYSLKIWQNDTLVKDFIPWTDGNGNYGLFDKVSFSAFTSTNQMTGSSNVNVVTVSGNTEYPLYYDEIQDPPSAVTFSSMTEAESMECPYVGLQATINGDKYIFSGNSTSGYEWVYQSSRLPVGYTEVEYIESPTTSEYPYINTNFAPNQNTRVIADLQYTDTNTHPRAFGCGTWNSNGYIFNAENGIPGEWRWKFGYNNGGWLTTNITSDFNRHTIEIDSGTLYLDGTQIGSTTVTDFQLTDNIALFGFLYNGSLGGTSVGEYMTGKFYSFKIYDNGTLARDFVPCVRDNDSKVGMYDIVGDSFYTSPNSFNFVAGNPV